MFCDVNVVNTENVVKIIWYKDEIPIGDDSNLNITIKNDTRFLFFPKLSTKLHNGVYRCAVLLANDQRIDSEYNLMVEILGIFLYFQLLNE